MGLCMCCLNAEEKHTRLIDQEIEHVKEVDYEVLKLLFLGTGGSGKTTIFKQMQLIYAGGFSREEKFMQRRILRKNTIEAIQALIIASANFGGNFEHKESGEYAALVMEMDPLDTDNWSPEFVNAVDFLWKSEPVIRQSFAKRNQFQLLTSADYLLDRVREFASYDYMPSPDDIIRSRHTTTGIHEKEFLINETRFRFLDVGGQRSERRKWIHCFEDVHAVIFVVAISEFDQLTQEEPRINRLVDSHQLFGEIANHELFRNTAMILFLNKSDLFAEKIRRGDSVKPAFPDYDCHSLHAARSFIADKFMTQNHSERLVFHHFTTAVDTNLIQKIFEDIRVVVTEAMLKSAELF